VPFGKRTPDRKVVAQLGHENAPGSVAGTDYRSFLFGVGLLGRDCMNGENHGEEKILLLSYSDWAWGLESVCFSLRSPDKKSAR
jgi:hypothetical protein